MLKLEKADGGVVFINLDRVIQVANHPDGELVVQYRNRKDEVTGMRCSRFQVIKQGVWYN